MEKRFLLKGILWLSLGTALLAAPSCSGNFIEEFPAETAQGQDPEPPNPPIPPDGPDPGITIHDIPPIVGPEFVETGIEYTYRLEEQPHYTIKKVNWKITGDIPFTAIGDQPVTEIRVTFNEPVRDALITATPVHGNTHEPATTIAYKEVDAVRKPVLTILDAPSQGTNVYECDTWIRFRVDHPDSPLSQCEKSVFAGLQMVGYEVQWTLQSNTYSLFKVKFRNRGSILNFRVNFRKDNETIESTSLSLSLIPIKEGISYEDIPRVNQPATFRINNVETVFDNLERNSGQRATLKTIYWEVYKASSPSRPEFIMETNINSPDAVFTFPDNQPRYMTALLMLKPYHMWNMMLDPVIGYTLMFTPEN